MDGLRPMNNVVAPQIVQDTGQCNRQEYWAQQILPPTCSNANWQPSNPAATLCNPVDNSYDYQNGNRQGQLTNHSSAMASLHQQHSQANAHYPGPVIGLQALCAACARLYPDQLNPLQVTARIKYWLGGPDPLDYISMFWNTGRPDINVPPHWHYVSFGLSDLHGDGRVHPPPTGPVQPDQLSGLGLELSFRVVGEPGRPPTWPAALLQRLATYVFKTGNRLCVGDHVSWHSALDGSDEALANPAPVPASAHNNQQSNNAVGKRKLKIRHMLIAQDQQLGTVDTPLGKVQFVQVVGVTDRELKAAQKTGGSPILETLANDPACGGRWLVTNLERSHSVTLPSSNHSPSELSGVAAVCKWEPWISSQDPVSPNYQPPSRETSELPTTVKEQIKCVLQKGLSGITPHGSKDFPIDCDLSGSQETGSKDAPKTIEDNSSNECKMSTDSAKFCLVEENSKDRPDRTYDSIKIPFNVQKDVAMSTDSFEMSKIEHALLEEVMNMPVNKSNATDAIKKESSEIGDVKLEVKLEQASNNNTYQARDGINDAGACYLCTCGQSDILVSEYITETNKNDKNESGQNAVDVCKRCRGRIPTEPRAENLQGVHLIFDKEAGSLLPLALRGRVLHGRHFTWTAVGGSQAVTLVPPSVSGAIVSAQNPIATANDWLQVLIPEDFAREMAEQLEQVMAFDDEGSDEESESHSAPPTAAVPPNIFCWPLRGLKITIGD